MQAKLQAMGKKVQPAEAPNTWSKVLWSWRAPPARAAFCKCRWNPARQGLTGSAQPGPHPVIFFEEKKKKNDGRSSGNYCQCGQPPPVAAHHLLRPCLQPWGPVLSPGSFLAGGAEGPAMTAHVQKPGCQKSGSRHEPTPERNQLFPTKIFLLSFQFVLFLGKDASCALVHAIFPFSEAWCDPKAFSRLLVPPCLIWSLGLVLTPPSLWPGSLLTQADREHG